MQTESTSRTIPIIVHAVAIALGLLLGWIAMERFIPEFPTGDPGIESSSEPTAVVGDDADSFFLPNNMSEAMLQLQDQYGTEQRVLRLHIEPGSIDAETTGAEGAFDLADVPVAAPLQLANHITAKRPKLGLAEIAYMDLVSTKDGPQWYVQIDINATDEPPPWTYTAPIEANSVSPGGAPPKPLAE